MEFPERVINAFKSEGGEGVDDILFQFHQFVAEHHKRSAEAQAVGIMGLEPPRVDTQVIMPNIDRLSSKVGELDPAIALIEIGRFLNLLHTNTMLFVAQVLATRNPTGEGQAAQAVQEYAQIAGQNFDMFLSKFMQPMDRKPASSLVGVDGRSLIQ